MLLINSVYINTGGVLSLMKCLVEKLNARQVAFRLLVDDRISDAFLKARGRH